MADIAEWDPVDDANTDAPPNGWPEFMQPSAVNNAARAMMGAIRRWYDTVTASLASINTSLNNKVNRSGDTMSGNLGISTSSGSSAIYLNKAPGAANNNIFGQVNGSARWLVQPGSEDPETGGNAGSDFVVHRYNDSGGYLSYVMRLSRQNGAASFAGNIAAGGSVTGTLYNFSGTQFAVKSTGIVVLCDDSGTAGVVLQSNGNNSYQNNAHNFYNRGGTVGYATINSAGLSVSADIVAGGTISGPTVVVSGASAGFRFYNRSGGSYCEWYQQDDAARLFSTVSGTTAWIMRVSDGFCYGNTNAVGGMGGYVNLSDIRLKEADTIAPAAQGLAEVLALKPVTFRRNPIEGMPPPRQETGFVAQDVQEVLSDAIVEVELDDGPALGIDSDAIVAALCNAVKTLDARLAVLEGGSPT